MNEDKLNELLGRFVGDLGAALHAGSIVIGEKLGLYKAMAESESRSSGRRNLNSTSLRLHPERLWDKESHKLSGWTE